MTTFNLSKSVGKGGVNNPKDVLVVKTRLADLGFPVTKDSTIDPDTIAVIKLFQSIINGDLKVLGKLWKTAISAPLLPESPCGALTPSAVAGVFQSLLR